MIAKKVTAIMVMAVLASSVAVASYFAMVPKRTYLAYAQENQPDAMATKLRTAVNMLTTPGLGQEAYMKAMEEGMTALYMSNLVVLPTPGVEETGSFFDVFVPMANEFTAALDKHMQNRELGTDASRAAAVEHKDFVIATLEAQMNIARETAKCDPNKPEGCELLQQGDEGGNVIDPVLNPAAGQPPRSVVVFFREVRSPFPIVAPFTVPQEQVITPGVLKRGNCTPIVKEFQGIKVVVRPVKIPIWVEPWTARATIVGFKIVWIWEFVPAEFVKTITYCNIGGQVTQTVDMKIIHERGLMHFWKFLPKDP